MIRRMGWRGVAAAIVVAACGTEDDGGRGTLALSVSGEDAAEVGFPVPGVEELVFADGWSVRFDKYLIGLGRVRVASSDGAVGVEDDEIVVVDLTAGEQQVFTFEEVPARRWDDFGYDILPPTASARVVGGVAEADVQRMIDGGFNYWIEGVATRGERSRRFAWGLAAPTRNDRCVNASDGTPGVVVRNNATAPYQITLHLDHLFYDRLGAHDGASMRFEAIAAAADDQGVIHWEDLADRRLSMLVDTEGNPIVAEAGAPPLYDTAGVPGADENLQAYLLAASRSQGRFHGEGECRNRSID